MDKTLYSTVNTDTGKGIIYPCCDALNDSITIAGINLSPNQNLVIGSTEIFNCPFCNAPVKKRIETSTTIISTSGKHYTKKQHLDGYLFPG